MTAGAVSRIGRYRVEEVIGAGAFATVHRAVDDRLGDDVALKVLAENHSLDPDVRERFITEGRVLRRIDSAHVVRVHDLGETDRQQPFLVLEHADRGTLARRVAALRAGGCQPAADDARAGARPLAAAVAAVHRADAVHRDLSPGNILLRTGAPEGEAVASEVIGPDERLLVADLGLCKDLAVSSGLTAAGGTEGFRPPEQAGPATVGPRADLWALSALLVWLVTGAPPGDDPLRRRLDRLPFGPRLAAALGTSLSADPVRRHRDVAAWLGDVETALRPPVPGRGPGRDPAADADRPGDAGTPRVMGRPLRWVALGLALVAVLVVGLVAARDGQRVTRLDDGRVRTTAATADAVVAVVGPGEVAVGETATFAIETDDAIAQWVWIAPDGRLVTAAPTLRLRAGSPGRAEIGLLATTGSGARLEVRQPLDVVAR